MALKSKKNKHAATTSLPSKKPGKKTNLSNTSQSSSSPFFLTTVTPMSMSVTLAMLLLAFAVPYCFRAFGTNSPLSGDASSLKSDNEAIATNTGNESPVFEPFLKSDMVDTEPYRYLSPSSSSDQKCPNHTLPTSVLLQQRTTTVTWVLQNFNHVNEANQFLVMLNGENEGLLLAYYDWTCLFDQVYQAAHRLGISPALLDLGIRLYTPLGIPITTSTHLLHDRIVYVLYDFQTWIWPGIRLGHTVVDPKTNVTLTTLSLSPKVFDVQGFFTSQEADWIIEEGGAHLTRSKAASDDKKKKGEEYVENERRTSYTAFLPESNGTRFFQKKSAQVARLSSASYTEGLQLVRYEQGQFFRRHSDTLETKQFFKDQKKGVVLFEWKDYEAWCHWTASRLDEYIEAAASQDESGWKIPPEFQKRGALYPRFLEEEDGTIFSNALLTVFVAYADKIDYWGASSTMEWEDYFKKSLDSPPSSTTTDMMKLVLNRKYNVSKMLPWIIKSWEEKFTDAMITINNLKDDAFGTTLIHVRYIFPPKIPSNGVSHYYHWIRWCKHAIATEREKHNPFFRSQEGEDERIAAVFGWKGIPTNLHPTMSMHPTYTKGFQKLIVKLLFDRFPTKESFCQALNDNISHVHKEEDDVKKKVEEEEENNRLLYDDMVRTKDEDDALFHLLDLFPQLFSLVVQTWETRVFSTSPSSMSWLQYTIPFHVPQFHPQRVATIFLYLNDVEGYGGETVFPHSTARYPRWTTEQKKEEDRNGMLECVQGLAIPPKRLHASLFYVQNADGSTNSFSKHGGCPPSQGRIKWGSNSFLWDSVHWEGSDAHR